MYMPCTSSLNARMHIIIKHVDLVGQLQYHPNQPSDLQSGYIHHHDDKSDCIYLECLCIESIMTCLWYLILQTCCIFPNFFSFHPTFFSPIVP